jgi:Ca-activated chloride channel homolog
MRWAGALALVLLTSVAGEADRAFRAGDYPRAAELYAQAITDDGGTPEGHYNLGTALLRAGRFDAAREQLAIAQQGDGAVRQRAFYNAGNTDLEPAFLPDAAPARDEVLRAIEAYRAALRLEPDDLDAKWNLELAQRLLDELPPAPQAGGGGGGAGDDRSPARPDPEPRRGAEGRESPQLTPEQASELLREAATHEQDVQRQRLRNRQAPPPRVRDW